MGFLPSKPHISDFELAEKLNLDLPQLGGVKAAVAKKDQKASAALGIYLNTASAAARWSHRQARPNARASPINGSSRRSVPEARTIRSRVPRVSPRCRWGTTSIGISARTNAFVEPAQWGHVRIVGNAYANSGDPKYAEAMIRSCGRSTAPSPGRRPSARRQSSASMARGDR